MKSLKTIQTLAKIAKIISKIIFICSIIGFCGCLAGIISIALGAPVLKVGDLTVSSIVQMETGVSMGTMYASMAADMAISAAEGVLAKFAEHYFARELKDGTPFDLGGAKELMRLGILAICLPLAGEMIAQIVYGIIQNSMENVASLDLDISGGVATGVMLIVIAVICKYGAELFAGAAQNAAPEATAETENES